MQRVNAADAAAIREVAPGQSARPVAQAVCKW